MVKLIVESVQSMSCSLASGVYIIPPTPNSLIPSNLKTPHPYPNKTQLKDVGQVVSTAPSRIRLPAQIKVPR